MCFLALWEKFFEKQHPFWRIQIVLLQEFWKKKQKSLYNNLLAAWGDFFWSKILIFFVLPSFWRSANEENRFWAFSAC